MYSELFETIFGHLHVKATEKGIYSLSFSDHDQETATPNKHTTACKNQLEEYFSKQRQKFELDIDFQMGSPFQQSVWTALLNIPYGQTTSYIALARALNNEKAVRAVGAANGKNPIPIIVPCHRVIGSNGSLIGYALGLDLKKKLLYLENPQGQGIQGELF